MNAHALPSFPATLKRKIVPTSEDAEFIRFDEYHGEELVMKHTIDLRDRAVREALIARGWIPPMTLNLVRRRRVE